MLFSKTLTFTIMAFALLFTGTIAHAQDTMKAVPPPVVDIVPAKSVDVETTLNNNTHPPVRLTPDKSELIKLSADVTTIVVGNPAHLSVLAESARTLVLVPKMPGATHFTVLDSNGNVIMQRHAIVASPKKQYVRVRKSCAKSTDDNCQGTQVFYCPDMCHEIALNDGEDAKPAAAAASSGAAAGGNAPSSPPADSE